MKYKFSRDFQSRSPYETKSIWKRTLQKVCRCVFMMERHFLLRQMGTFFCYSAPIQHFTGQNTRWLSLVFFRSKFSRWSPLFQLFLGRWFVPVDAYFAASHQMIHKLLRTTLKVVSRLCFCWLVGASISYRIWPLWSFEMPTVSAILRILNRRLKIRDICFWCWYLAR